MKTLIAALAVTLGLMSVTLPASADYVSPDASRFTKALNNGY